jgi:hypothetical protein
MAEYPGSFVHVLTEKEANPKDEITFLTKEELMKGDKIGTHIAEEEFTLYRNIQCSCPRYFEFLNRIRGPKRFSALAELQIPIGTTMVSYGYKTLMYNINFKTMQYEKGQDIQTNVHRGVKINQAIVKNIFQNHSFGYNFGMLVRYYALKDNLDNCECYDLKNHFAYLTITERENPIKYKKGEMIHSYRNDMKEYSFLRSDELIAGFDKDDFMGYD